MLLLLLIATPTPLGTSATTKTLGVGVEGPTTLPPVFTLHTVRLTLYDGDIHAGVRQVHGIRRACGRGRATPRNNGRDGTAAQGSYGLSHSLGHRERFRGSKKTKPYWLRKQQGCQTAQWGGHRFFWKK